MSSLLGIAMAPAGVALAWAICALKDEVVRRLLDRRVRRGVVIDISARNSWTSPGGDRAALEDLAKAVREGLVESAEAESAARALTQRMWTTAQPPLSLAEFRDVVERVTAAAIVERDEARHTTHCTWMNGAVNAHCLTLRLLGGYGMQSFDLDWARAVLSEKGEPRSDKLHWSLFPGLRTYDVAAATYLDMSAGHAVETETVSLVAAGESTSATWPIADGIFPSRDAAAEPNETDAAAPATAAANSTGDAHA